MGARAYQQTMDSIADPKVSEAKVISAVTNGLERHAEEGRHSGPLRDYLIKNQKLWSALRSDLSSSDNTLPTDLKAKLVSLSLWVDRQTSAFLTGGGGISEIIAVNRSLAAGLCGNAGAR